VYGLGEEGKTCASSHGNVPFALLSILVLTGEELKEYGNDFRKCDFGKVLGNFNVTIEETLQSSR
jgi:hypothetical protein